MGMSVSPRRIITEMAEVRNICLLWCLALSIVLPLRLSNCFVFCGVALFLAFCFLFIYIFYLAFFLLFIFVLISVYLFPLLFLFPLFLLHHVYSGLLFFFGLGFAFFVQYAEFYRFASCFFLLFSLALHLWFLVPVLPKHFLQKVHSSHTLKTE